MHHLVRRGPRHRRGRRIRRRRTQLAPPSGRHPVSAATSRRPSGIGEKRNGSGVRGNFFSSALVYRVVLGFLPSRYDE